MKISLLNLGCKVNQYEIDAISASLTEHELINELENADIYILNTCAVTAEAEKKSRQYIAKINKINPNAQIIVCGCASEHSSKQFAGKPNVVAIIGTAGKGGIKNIVESVVHYVTSNKKDGNTNAEKEKNSGNVLGDKLKEGVKEIPCVYEDDLFSRQTRTRGYLKIQDGCDCFCSYCLIPFIRGRSRSRPLSSIVKEAQSLSETCLEIVITGINMSDFKIDKKPALEKLMTSLGGVNCRFRLSSLENGVITDEFLVALGALKNFCPHFHLSLQSGSNKVLKDMNRRYTREDFLKKVELIYKYFPQAAITTDIIVGYPTETDGDFNDTLDLVRESRFAAVHFFAYSNRAGTVAGRLPQINGVIIKQRENVLRKLSQEYEQKYISKFISEPLEVLIEEKVGDFFVGYSQNYIRCYVRQNNINGIKGGQYDETVGFVKSAAQKLNCMVRVVGKELFKDGLLCE